MFRSTQGADTTPVGGDMPRPMRESSTSREKVDVARRCVDAYNRRDLGALRTLSDRDLELDWSASRWLHAGVYRGVDAFLRFCADYFEAFEEIILQPDCFMAAGEAVVVPNVAHARGRDGIEVVARSTIAITVRGRKVTGICLYQGTRPALEAVGRRDG
jgi:ketosteroid isomerase-like protein